MSAHARFRLPKRKREYHSLARHAIVLCGNVSGHPSHSTRLLHRRKIISEGTVKRRAYTSAPLNTEANLHEHSYEGCANLLMKHFV
jgi:hypothetical protein